jgi:hypothetical protein
MFLGVGRIYLLKMNVGVTTLWPFEAKRGATDGAKARLHQRSRRIAAMI